MLNQKYMKPFSILLSINLAFFAVWGLMFTLVFNRPELIPFFTSSQAAINLLGIGIFHLDGKPQIRNAFFWGLLISVAVTVVGYILLDKYKHLIAVEESYTVMLEIQHWIFRA